MMILVLWLITLLTFPHTLVYTLDCYGLKLSGELYCYNLPQVSCVSTYALFCLHQTHYNNILFILYQLSPVYTLKQNFSPHSYNISWFRSVCTTYENLYLFKQRYKNKSNSLTTYTIFFKNTS